MSKTMLENLPYIWIGVVEQLGAIGVYFDHPQVLQSQVGYTYADTVGIIKDDIQPLVFTAF